MIDSDNHPYRKSTPKGKLRPAIWIIQVDYAKVTRNPLFNEIVSNTKELFLSVIQDYASSQAVFSNGKAPLNEDVLATFRAHLALRFKLLALHCILIEKLVTGEIAVKDWEEGGIVWLPETVDECYL